MDLNPLFTNYTAFGSGELNIFEQAGIKLVHGWLADPDTPDFHTLSKWSSDYDSAMNLIADADHLTKGRLVQVEAEENVASGSDRTNTFQLSEEDKEKVEAGTYSLCIGNALALNRKH